jgi:hypothetical protein
MTSRRHHFIPQFYLKGFTVERKKKRQLAVFDGKDRKAFMAAIDNVALERDFNRVEVEGLEPDAFEKAMAAFEAEMAPALDRIVAAQSIEAQEDRIALVNLIGALALRNPRLRETIRDFHERAVKQVMDFLYATPEVYASHRERMLKEGKNLPTVSYEDMKKFVEEGNYKIEVATTRHIQLEVETFNKVLPILLARNWLMLRAPTDSGGFVTSDHPVVLVWSKPEMRGGLYGPGFGLAETSVFFPICTRLALIGAFELKEAVIDVPESSVAAFNGAQIAYAERQVYARDHNFKYAMQPGEEPRKASRLIDDKRFRKGRASEE